MTEAEIASWLDDGRSPQRWPFAQRAASVLWQRYVCQPPLTLAALGQRLGVTRQRVQQIEARALALLRQSPYRERLAASGAVRPGTPFYQAVFGDDAA